MPLTVRRGTADDIVVGHLPARGRQDGKAAEAFDEILGDHHGFVALLAHGAVGREHCLHLGGAEQADPDDQEGDQGFDQAEA